MPTVTIKRQRRISFVGVSHAARVLGVSRSAVSNYVSGRCPSSLSPEKRALIKIEDGKDTIAER